VAVVNFSQANYQVPHQTRLFQQELHYHPTASTTINRTFWQLIQQ